MASGDFGVYILTYPGDFHLSTVLVRSIQQVSPDIPIMIIPGEGFDHDDHPFDVPVMPAPTGFWAQIGHQDRCFWAFQGPFDTFLYLDADMICTKSLANLRQRVGQQQGNFIYIHPSIGDQDWLALLRNPHHPENQKYARQVKREIGRDSLTKFDPDYNILANCPFNTGLFVSRRLAITDSDLASLNQAERKFYRDSLKKEWNWKSSELFFRDQGRLNYLVNKLSIPIFRLKPDLICRAGASAIHVSFADVARELVRFSSDTLDGRDEPKSFVVLRPAALCRLCLPLVSGRAKNWPVDRARLPSAAGVHRILVVAALL